MPDLSRIRARLGSDRGFTMIVTVLVLMLVMLFSAAAFAVANNDNRPGQYTINQKQAYAAAEAGMSWFLANLQQDPNYWTHCTNVPNVTDPSGQSVPAPINDPPTGATGRWRTIAGSSEQYSIDLLHAPGKNACDPSDPVGSMVDPATGTFQVRANGRSGANGPHRSIVATFRRKGYLDFVYYTHLEVMDPTLWFPASIESSSTGAAGVTPSDVVQWVDQHCSETWQDGRATDRYSGTVNWAGGGSSNYTNADLCSNANIQFATFDSIAGPLHTDDSMLICGTPTFGRTTQDLIESATPSSTASPPPVQDQPWRSACNSSTDRPNFQGTWEPGAQPMDPPPDDSALAQRVSPGYLFTGQTKIVLGTPGPGQMTVTNSSMGLNGAVYNQPTNGVIYVQSSNCSWTYDRTNPYGAPQGCGDVYVHGTYSTSMTIGSDNDVLVDGDLLGNATSVMGLIANHFVRVYHPCGTTSGSNREIDAAILALNDSFLVDNWTCDQLGSLTVKGVIAQKYRGVVGTGGNSPSYTGYKKNYTYDDRLRYQSPPAFLDPVRSAWQVVRMTEQVPAS